MKTRISTLGTVLLVTLALNLFAERIEKEVAEQIGKNYYWEASRDSKTLKYDEITLNLFTTKSENETPLYYIFNINSKDGFIIVAADDNVIPVLGYSFDGRWDETELPPAFDQMLDVFENQIRTIIEEQIEGGVEVEALWEKYGNFNPNPEKSKSVSPLLTTTWNQNQYYNGMCPVDINGPGGRAYAGCVAVSMAQVMKFWGHPTQGSGSYSYTHPVYGTLSANFGATTYSYNLMPNSISGSNSYIAQLLYHCGVSVSMNYGPYGSAPMGTYWDLDITNALKNYFKYSSSAAWDWKVNYSNSTWITKLKNELDNGRPLIYYGWDGGTMAHNFNCDGYRSTDNYFHFNWGWGGWYDGYFPITNLTPAQGYSFTYYQGAIFNLTPNTNPTVYYDFGDAPTPYPTLSANNGACHQVPANPTVYLGYSVDTEPDGQPHINCTGDDTDILYPPVNDDEDGVIFPAIVYRNTINTITVVASSTGYLQGWLDYNQNSLWGDPGEQVFTNYPLLPGANVLQVNIPSTANTGWTYARFRFSSVMNLSFTGSAPNGEVEDYFIRINEPTPQGFDFGDAPDSYQTMLASNGARHFYVPGLFLGNGIDLEPDGQPDPMAMGDDLNNTDDEDGVVVQNTLMAGPGGFIYVIASNYG
ncbi:MAG: C10 family peptidase, partial [Bacteroidales bacterium]|nr:C10 family peptidase [Bacteroidales bacterium]